jgi:hypothetical protein
MHIFPKDNEIKLKLKKNQDLLLNFNDKFSTYINHSESKKIFFVVDNINNYLIYFII